MLSSVVASQSLSGRAKTAFAALLVVPSVAAVVWGNTDSEVVAVDATLSVEADGVSLRSDFITNPCGEPLRLEVTESSQTVQARTLVEQEAGWRGCTDMSVPRRLAATLSAPLGDRTLVAVPGP